MTRLVNFSVFSVLSVATVLAGSACEAQPYPSRPVRIVVPVPAGGGVDSIARIAGEYMRGTLGQPFVVDNRPGAGGSIGAEIVAKATPDGYTLMVSSSSFVTNAAVRKVPYDPIKDFQPVTRLTSNPYIIVVTPSLPAASVQELVALAKTRPGGLNYASSGNGGILHMGAALLAVMTGARMTHVPYKGVAEGYPAVMTGQVDWMLGSPISALPLMKAGRLKGIAVTSTARAKALPDIPTIAESGVPGYEVNAWFGLFAPARTPAAIVDRLHQEARAAIHRPEILRRMEAEGTEVGGNLPKAFSAEVAREYATWRSLVAKAGLKL